MKKLMMIIILVFIGVFSGCTNYEQFDIYHDQYKIVLNIDEEYDLDLLLEEVEWESSDQGVIMIEDNYARAVDLGYSLVSTQVEDQEVIYLFVVKEIIDEVVITGVHNLDIGEEGNLQAFVLPGTAKQDLVWSSNDSDVVSVDENGKITGINYGLATITASSTVNPLIYKKHLVMVEEDKDFDLENQIKLIFENIHKTIDLDSLTGILEPLITVTSDGVIGVSGYYITHGNLEQISVGSGLIYKREAIKDGVITEGDDFDYYRYYVATNRHVIKDFDAIKVFYQDTMAEIDASVIEYDDKVDLAVITFESKLYFPVLEFGDSSSVQTGEFVVAIGHGNGYKYFRSATFGVVSFPKRYMSDDTTGDGMNDWDAEYIQHDASINKGNSGGPIINLRGEVIGINTVKISSITVENMGFAIPSNLALEIIELLEQGIRPQRAILGITVVNVKAVIDFPSTYPEITIPEIITHGFYVNTVSEAGIGYSSGLLEGDIIVEYNNIKMRYSHELRAEIRRFLIGSGDVVEMVIYRNNQFMTLNVVY